MILVTKPFSPPIEEYNEKIKGIWDRNYFTNNGPLVQQLEKELKEYLGVSNLTYLTNGTISLQIALKSLPKKGKILTTPFSYIATSSSIVWEGFTPVFIDIDSNTFNVDSSLIEQNIDEETIGMLFTHCFGVPCDLLKIEEISKKYSIPVIYDAAHAFGVKFNGKSILNYGWKSSLSFHATKLFHTIEGGALVCADFDQSEVKNIELLRNFGHDGPEVFNAVGINGKNSEFHAAMGICNLKYIDEILSKRKEIYQLYLSLLEGLKLSFQHINEAVDYNYAYFPVVFENESVLKKVMQNLNEHEIFPRRYFYPSLNTLDVFSDYYAACPNSEKIAASILCLPIYHDLKENEIELVCRIIKEHI